MKQINLRMQSGTALIFFSFILVLIITAYAINTLNSSEAKTNRNIKTNLALAEAKAALIGWSVGHASKPGSLPCTDSFNTGSGATNGANACVGYLARLPWKQLGLEDLRDGNGECLWYALSPVFRNNMNNGTRVAQPLVTASGAITLEYPGGASKNNIVAVVFSPGVSILGQDRSGTGTVCGGNANVANYLENYNESSLIFSAGTSTLSFNDKLVYVTKDDIYIPLRKRMANEMMGNVAVPSGPYDFFSTFSKYPCASDTLGGTQQCLNPSSTFLPFADLQYSQLGTWMQNNGWLAIASYTYTDALPMQSKLVVSFNGTSTCIANGAVTSCTP